MSKSKNKKKKKILILRVIVGIYRFFIPKNFSEELYKGRTLGEQIKQGQVPITKCIPTYWIGKGLRRIIDPKHKMKIRKGKQ